MAEPTGPDIFARAQTRLALLFAGIVIVLVIVSSVFMYLTFRADIRAAAGRDFNPSETESEYVNRSLGRLRWQLLVVDGVIVAAVGVGGLLYARSTLKPIRATMAAQKQFIADASHDLRTPLAVMKADFEVTLRDPSLGGEARAALESGLEEVDGMTAMVDDLLTLSRIDADQEALSAEPLDLGTLAAQTADKLRELARRGDVVLECAAGQAPAVGDPGHVRRALLNVVRNAVEHSPHGGRVDIAASGDGGVSRVVVSDHGDGITPADLAHIFDRFYRGDAARSPAHGGSGLGLAIARWALREMGGDIVVESAVGSGTRVTLSLPRQRV